MEELDELFSTLRPIKGQCTTIRVYYARKTNKTHKSHVIDNQNLDMLNMSSIHESVVASLHGPTNCNSPLSPPGSLTHLQLERKIDNKCHGQIMPMPRGYESSRGHRLKCNKANIRKPLPIYRRNNTSNELINVTSYKNYRSHVNKLINLNYEL